MGLQRFFNLALRLEVPSAVVRKPHSTHALPITRIADLPATVPMNLANLLNEDAQLVLKVFSVDQEKKWGQAGMKISAENQLDTFQKLAFDLDLVNSNYN